MAAYFILNSSVDILPYVAADGFKLVENDVDAPDAGRTLDAIMHRGKVATKKKGELKLIPMTSFLKNRIFQELRNEYFWAHYHNDRSGEDWECEMYNSSRGGTIAMINSDGIEIWDDISINLIER